MFIKFIIAAYPTVSQQQIYINFGYAKLHIYNWLIEVWITYKPLCKYHCPIFNHEIISLVLHLWPPLLKHSTSEYSGA